MFTWRWCCCERRCPSPRRPCLPTLLVAWHQTRRYIHQRRPGSSTPQVQTCPGRHLCTWASPSLCRPGDEGLNTYSLWQVELPTDTSAQRFIQDDKTDRPALCATAPGNTSRGNRGCRSLSEMCWDRRSFPCSCSRPSLLGRRRAAAGGQTQRNRKRDTCTPPGKQNTITYSSDKLSKILTDSFGFQCHNLNS